VTLDLKLWQSRFSDYMMARNWSPHTLSHYTHALVRFFDFLGSQEVASVADITRDVVFEYRNWLYHLISNSTAARLSVCSQANILCAVKAFCYFLAHEHYILLDPSTSIEIPKVPDTLPRVLLTEAEVKRLIEAPDTDAPLGLRDRAIIELLYCSAIRNGELCAIHCEDLHLLELELHVVCGKGGKGRRVPLGEEAAYWLERYLGEVRPRMEKTLKTAALFLNRRGKPLDDEALNLIIHLASERAGLAVNVTAHVLRHACAMHCLARGMGLRHLQLLLGHSSVESTMRYLRMEISDLQEVHRRCHPRENGVPL
jgi:integrase/recombinase XerD